jgi:hypothetical protein
MRNSAADGLEAVDPDPPDPAAKTCIKPAATCGLIDLGNGLPVRLANKAIASVPPVKWAAGGPAEYRPARRRRQEILSGEIPTTLSSVVDTSRCPQP